MTTLKSISQHISAFVESTKSNDSLSISKIAGAVQKVNFCIVFVTRCILLRQATQRRAMCTCNLLVVRGSLSRLGREYYGVKTP